MQGREGSFLTIDQMDKSMVPVLKDLKVGEFSQPVEFADERGKKGVRIIFLKSSTEPHRENLRDDYSRIAMRALEEKKNDALDAWFSNKVKTYHIMVDDEFKDCAPIKKWLPVSTVSK